MDALGSSAHHVFTVSGGKTLKLENLTLKGGKGKSGTFGGAILVTSGSNTAELTDCAIEDCHADNGGAIYAKGAAVNLTTCALKGNEAKSGGAVCALKTGTSASTVTGGTIGGTGTDANKATGSNGQGGGIYVGTNCTLTLQNNVQLIGNTAAYGGGVYAIGATVTVTSCTLKGNTAKIGGAIFALKSGTPANVTINGGTIGGMGATDANKATGSGVGAGRGGGINVEAGCILTMQNSVQVIGNSALTFGGSIYAVGATVNITNCPLKGNMAKSGGAICALKSGAPSNTPSTVTIKGGAIGGTGTDANKATDYSLGSYGGGIYIDEFCTLNLQNGVQVTGNTAQKGNGIYAKAASLGMQGRAEVDVNNDVFLDGDAKISADSVLNPASGIAARITVPTAKYLPSTHVLTAA